MRTRLASIVALTLFAIPPASSRADGPSIEGLDPFVDGVLAEWKVPGMAVAVVKGGEVIHIRGYGFRDLEARKPVTPKTLFAIGSISKSFAATGLGILVDQGKLTWDAPVRDFLPEFRLKDKFASETATVRDLLSHRTGLPRHDSLWYASGLGRRQILERLRYLEPSKELRAGWQYNNLMYLAAGMVDERVSGKPWEDLTRDRIFRPMGMSASNFSVAESRKSDDFALPYAKVQDVVKRVPFYNLDAMAPVGGINSNVEEMIRYVRMHIDGGKHGDSQILTRASAERLRSPEAVIPDGALGPLHSPNFPELGHLSYGMGFFVTTYRGRELAWHSGSIDGFSALMSILPAEKAGVIVLTNLSGNRPAPVCVTRRALDHLLGLEPIDWVARAKELERKAEAAGRESREKEQLRVEIDSSPAHSWDEYAATYEHPAYGVGRGHLPRRRPDPGLARRVTPP